MAYQPKPQPVAAPALLKIFRTNAKACDFCDEEPTVLLHLVNGVQVCPACRKAVV